ncbi:MAG TPA: hypothetical protein VM577_03715, partial [Anaerovoracaceae bacterium]|nr:hypothetical protein [Anaerovoracaceae bacterium]
EHNHTWQASYDSVVHKKSWCPHCNGIPFVKLIDGLERAQQYATVRGGLCLSTEFVDVKSPMLWKCSNPEHQQWHSSYTSVVTKQHWCPQCSNANNVSEQRAISLIDHLLGTHLVKAKPHWNINPDTGRKLELDGYDKKKKIAVEFQGEHHFVADVYPNLSLEEVQKRDRLKVVNCQAHDVHLILVNIPSLKERNSFDAFLTEVLRAIKQSSLPFAVDTIDEAILKKLFNKPTDRSLGQEKIEKATKFALSKNGKLLSNEYVNQFSEMIWKCHNDAHEPFVQTYTRVLFGGAWCRECTLEDIKKRMEHHPNKGKSKFSKEQLVEVANLIKARDGQASLEAIGKVLGVSNARVSSIFLRLELSIADWDEDYLLALRKLDTREVNLHQIKEQTGYPYDIDSLRAFLHTKKKSYKPMKKKA